MVKHLLLITLILLLSGTATKAAEVTVVTEEGALQFSKNNQVSGVATDLVRAVLDKVDTDYTIDIYPWPRAYAMALTKPNVLIYSMTRTPQRESKFRWVGEIIPINYSLFRLKSKPQISPQTIEQAKQYSIGVINNGAVHKYFQRQRFLHIHPVSNITSHVKKFASGRVDLIALNTTRLPHLCKSNIIDCHLIEPVITLPKISTGLYLAFSHNSDDKLVKQAQLAYTALKQDGTYQKIMAPALQP